jgi:anti-sigma regulatory factor (Ser/Thr protein kinase)
VRTRWSCQEEWAGTPASVSSVRDFVTARLGLELPDLVDEIRLVASELATNAVRHAQTPFVVTLEREDGEVMVSVRDGSSRLPVTGPANNFANGGRGLVLVSAMSATWGVTVLAEGGKSVWARIGPSTPV